MAGAAKNRANQEPSRHHADGNGSSSGDTSSSGKATRSARSDGHANHSTGQRRGGYDGNDDAPRSRRSSTSSNPDPVERNPATSRPAAGDLKNIDLPVAGWSAARGVDLPRALAARPAPSKLGTPIKIALNTYDVQCLPTSRVHQYDVLIGSGTEKRGLIKKIWASKAVKEAIGKGFIFDGNKLAWSMNMLDREAKITVDLDKEDGKAPRADGKTNIHRVIIRHTNSVRLDQLTEYLAGKVTFDNSVLESINFLDHLIREYPSLQYTSIKRSFFARGKTRFSLGSGVEGFKGVFASMRIVHGGPGAKARVSINVDVANSAFWQESTLPHAAAALANRRDVNDLAVALGKGEKSAAAQELKKMRRLHVVAAHRGGKRDSYVIERFVFKSAKDEKFEKNGKMVSIYDYFMREFSIRLEHPDLPLVKMTKGKNTLLPMEVLKIEPNERYPFKLDERQTTAMLKFAATPPPDRRNDINNGLRMLSWDNDPVLKAHGVKISPNMSVVDAKLIPAPKVQFGQGDAKPGTSGRWDLKGKKFLSPNAVPLKSWAVCVIPGRRGGKPDRTAVQNFIQEFIKIYKLHGGRVENSQPTMNVAQGEDVGAWVTSTWNTAGNQSNLRPQMLVFILPDKNANVYGRIKRSADCRYGVVSQCMQYAHVQKAQPQYISNVCMKFNAKLGGQTCRAMGPKSSGTTGIFSVPTVIIGADVSHASPGAETPSLAALTVSMDRLGIRYAAACETNGFRMEMIQTANINSLLKPMLQTWVSNVGGGKFPSRIIYFRDGVSEGQYSHVLEQEVHDMKALLKTADPSLNIPFVVIVGGKRHHVRFFPEKGDKNGNPLPGTLVESGVTNPFEFDFYLNSHSAIKGTARPMHYHVLINEANMPPEEIQTMIYEQCYQYIKSSTPISQHPAIYYAHIAAARAIPHDPKWAGTSDTPASAAGGPHSHGGSSGQPAEYEKLLPMPNQAGINTSMWFI